MHRLGLALAAASLAVFSFTSCSNSSATARASAAEPHTLKDRRPAPNFTLKDASGQNISLNDYKGKIVLLNFWATWCGPCELEIPWFEQFEQQYKSKGFEVLGVSMDEDGWNVVKPFIAKHNVNYRVLLGNDSVGALYGGVDSLPTTFIIDREGRFAFPPHVGLAGKNEYLSEIQTLLGVNNSQSARLLLPHPATATLFARPAE